MPYSRLAPTGIEQVESDNCFVVPATNDNMRRVDAMTGSLLQLTLDAFIPFGCPVRHNAHTGESSVSGVGPVIGIAAANSNSAKLTRVQIAGRALVTSIAPATLAAIGRVAVHTPGQRGVRVVGLDGGSTYSMEDAVGVVRAVRAGMYEISLGLTDGSARPLAYNAQTPAHILHSSAVPDPTRFLRSGKIDTAWARQYMGFYGTTTNELCNAGQLSTPSISGNTCTIALTKPIDTAIVHVSAADGTEICGECLGTSLALYIIGNTWAGYGSVGSTIGVSIRVHGVGA